MITISKEVVGISKHVRASDPGVPELIMLQKSGYRQATALHNSVKNLQDSHFLNASLFAPTPAHDA